MIEPYFALWLNVRNEQMKKESLIDATRASWKVMTFFERTVFVIFVIVAGIATTFNFGALFDPSLMQAAMISLIPFLVATLAMTRVADSFHKRTPQRAIRRSSLFSKELAKSLRGLGLCAPDQVRLVRDEAIRILNSKERRTATIMRYTFELVILCLLAAGINFVFVLLGHDVPLETASCLLACMAVAAGALVFLVWVACRVCDRLSDLPAKELGRFISDLTSLLVDRPKALPSRRRIRRHVRIR